MALVVDYYSWLTANSAVSFGSIFSFLLFGLVVEAFQGAVKDAADILTTILRGVRRKIININLFGGI